MNLFTVSHSCLMEILYKKTPFKLAIENTCSKNTVFREDRKNITNVIGCALRHFYIFDYLISLLDKDFSEHQKVTLLLHLSNELFVPVFPSEEINSGLKTANILASDIEKLRELTKDKTKLIPPQYTNDSLEYLHYRYNIPIWILKMWMKHFKGYTYKIVKTINRPSNNYAIINNHSIDNDFLKKEHPEIKTTQFDGLYFYDGNVAPKRHSLFIENKMVTISPALYYLLNKLDLDVIRKIAIYSETYNILHLQLAALLGGEYRGDIISGSAESYYSVKKDLEKYPLKNVNLYEAKHSSIITCLSEKVHNFFVIPKNSNFGEFRKSPDYFNRVNQGELDEDIANQKQSLLSASDFVENGGNLIYIVATMDKKESAQIVDGFLEERKDFVLLEQKQFLPFDKYDSTLFIAIFRKEESDD